MGRMRDAEKTKALGRNQGLPGIALVPKAIRLLLKI
jgi:hypothetical protein